MSIRHRIIVFLALTMTTLLLLLTTTTIQWIRTDRRLDSIQNNNFQKLELAYELNRVAIEVRHGIQAGLAAEDIEMLNEVYAHGEEEMKQIAEGTQTDDKTVSAILLNFSKYIKVARDAAAFRASNAPTTPEVLETLHAFQIAQNNLLGSLNQIRSENRAAMRKAIEATRRDSRIGVIIFSCVAFACMIGLALLTWIFLGQIHTSLTAISTGLKRFEKGDLLATIPNLGTHELGAVAQMANSMAMQLQRSKNDLLNINRELEAFSYSVSHDLRQPLRAMHGFSMMLEEEYANALDDKARHYLARIKTASDRMSELVDGLLVLSRMTRSPLAITQVDLSELARHIADDLKTDNPSYTIHTTIENGLSVRADKRLMEVLLMNLMSNAWKFSSKVYPGVVEVGQTFLNGEHVFFVRDNGAGFNMAYAEKLFAPFQRLHAQSEYPGIGIGLATVERVVHRHGGRIWAEGHENKGAVFYFTLPKQTKESILP